MWSLIPAFAYLQKNKTKQSLRTNDAIRGDLKEATGKAEGEPYTWMNVYYLPISDNSTNIFSHFSAHCEAAKNLKNFFFAVTSPWRGDGQE